MASEQERTTLSEAGRFYATQRRVITGHCASCGVEIQGIQQRRYCSATCRVRAYRQRKEIRIAKKGAIMPQPSNSVAEASPDPWLRPVTPEAVARLIATRDEITRERTMHDSTALIEQAREERIAEL